jgi:plasmid maintenance system antidote protein VapI
MDAIDSGLERCDNYRIMSTQAPSPITALLKRTIVESGIPYKALERETGVRRSSIQRFVDGRQSMRLDMADRLAAYFGLNLVEPLIRSAKKSGQA